MTKIFPSKKNNFKPGEAWTSLDDVSVSPKHWRKLAQGSASCYSDVYRLEGIN